MKYKWIPIGDRPPEKNDRYMTTICFENKSWVEMQYYNGEWDFFDNYVVAWAELPEPYKRSEK